jgi:hypothetical protein
MTIDVALLLRIHGDRHEGWRATVLRLGDRSVPLRQIYGTALERSAVMDTTGYDALWLAEHHFSGFSVCPSVHVMGTMAAAIPTSLDDSSQKRLDKLRDAKPDDFASDYDPMRVSEIPNAKSTTGPPRQYAGHEHEEDGGAMTAAALRMDTIRPLLISNHIALSRVRVRRTQHEHMSSGSPPKADIAWCSRSPGTHRCGRNR